MTDLDTRLRALASDALDRAAIATPVDADLAVVRARVATRPSSPPGAERTWPWQRLAVAAALVLLVGSAVALLASRGADEELVAPVTEPTIVPGPGNATVSERSVEQGQTLTITPAAEVPSITCERLVHVAGPDGEVGYVGREGWTAYQPDGPIEWCTGTPSDQPVTIVVPRDLAAGAYVVCVAGGDPDGCAELTVAEDGQDPAPPPASSATAEPAVVGRGGSVVITPASAVDVPCGDEYARVERQSAGRTELVGIISNGRLSGSDPPPDCATTTSAAPRRVSVPDEMPDGSYRVCVSIPVDADGCALVTVQGTAEPTITTTTPDLVTTTTPITSSTTTTSVVAAPAVLPVGYVERVYVDDPPYFVLREHAPDGSVVGEAGDDAVTELLRREVSVGEGTVRLLQQVEPYGRCDNRQVATSGPSPAATPDGDLIGPARSLAATVDGVVIVGVDVCPDGARWGDDGTRFELRRVDLRDGSTSVLFERLPGEGDTFFEDANVVYAGGELIAESVSPDGAFVAVAEPYTTEDTRYHVIDAVAGGDPIELGSSCDDPGDLVGPSRFVGDGLVVVARECSAVGGEIGDLVVELVSLATRQPVWSVEVQHVAIDSYSHTVSLSATSVDGQVWALVSASPGIEQPVTAAALTEGVEQPLPVAANVAFTPAELIWSWDPYSA